MEKGILSALKRPFECHQAENNPLGPFFAMLNLLLVHFQAKIWRNSSKKSAEIGRKVIKKVFNHRDLQRHIINREMIRPCPTFYGSTIAQLTIMLRAKLCDCAQDYAHLCFGHISRSIGTQSMLWVSS